MNLSKLSRCSSATVVLVLTMGLVDYCSANQSTHKLEPGSPPFPTNTTSEDVTVGISLPQAVKQSLVDYPAIVAMHAEIGNAKAELDKANAQRWPVINLSAQTSRQNSGNTSNVNITPQASYKIYAGGTIKSAIDKANHILSATKGKTEATRNEIALQTAEAYLMWARSYDQLNLAKNFMAAVSNIRDDVQRVVEIDRGRAIDLSQADVRVNSAELLKQQRALELQISALRLQRYTNQIPSGKPSGLDEGYEAVPTDLNSALEAIGPGHPQLKQFYATLDAARAEQQIARGQLLPKVELTISRQQDPVSGKTGTLTQLGVSIPVFNGGASYAGMRGAQEIFNSARANLEDQELILREKISRCWADLATAKSQIQLNSEQSAAGRKLVDSYRKQFRLARRSLLDLLNVQREAYEYDVAALQAKFDERLARIRLSAALGHLAESMENYVDITSSSERNDISKPIHQNME